MIPIRQQASLADIVENVRVELAAWFAEKTDSPPDLDRFKVPIYLKDADSKVTYANQTYNELFSHGVTPIGRTSSHFLDQSIRLVSLYSDALILCGAFQIEFLHCGWASDRKWYKFRTLKFDLSNYGDSDFSILGISDPIAVTTSPDSQEDTVEERFRVYCSLPSDYQAIVALIAKGMTTKEIAAMVDISKRTVDSRKAEILEKLSLTNCIELAVLLTRFEERGYVTAD